MMKFTVVLFIQSAFLILMIHLIESFRIQVTIEPVAANYTQTQFVYHGIETFDSRSSGAFQSDFGTSGILSVNYTGGVEIRNADRFGGSNGKGKYLRAVQFCDLLITNQRANGVNYFGLLMTYAEATDKILFYEDFSDTKLILELNLTSFNATAVDYTQYLGNPWMNKANPASLYAFLNFYFYDVTIRKVKIRSDVFSDNHVIGWFNGTSGVTVYKLEVPSTSTSSTSSTSSKPPILTSSTSKPTISSNPSTRSNSTRKNQSGVSIGIIVGFLVVQLFYYLS